MHETPDAFDSQFESVVSHLYGGTSENETHTPITTAEDEADLLEWLVEQGRMSPEEAANIWLGTNYR